MPQYDNNRAPFANNDMAERDRREEDKINFEITRRANLLKAAHDYALIPRDERKSSDISKAILIHSQLCEVANQVFTPIYKIFPTIDTVESYNAALKQLNEVQKYIEAEAALGFYNGFNTIKRIGGQLHSHVLLIKDISIKITEIDNLYTQCLTEIDNPQYRFNPNLLDSVSSLKAELKNVADKYLGRATINQCLLYINLAAKTNVLHTRLLNSMVNYIALTACGLSTKGYIYLAQDQEKICTTVENALKKENNLSTIDTSAKLDKVTEAIASTLSPLYHSQNIFHLCANPRLSLKPDFDKKAEKGIAQAVMTLRCS